MPFWSICKTTGLAEQAASFSGIATYLGPGPFVALVHPKQVLRKPLYPQVEPSGVLELDNGVCGCLYFCFVVQMPDV